MQNTRMRRPLRARGKSRRKTLGLLGGALLAPFVIGSEARAQAAWPTKTVRYINPYPAGIRID